MDNNKTKAKSLRAMADHFDEIAKISNDVGDFIAARHHRNSAEHHRLEADKLDHPQPEWEEGDYAMDEGRSVWSFKNGKWDGEYSTKELINHYGPIHKV